MVTSNRIARTSASDEIHDDLMDSASLAGRAFRHFSQAPREIADVSNVVRAVSVEALSQGLPANRGALRMLLAWGRLPLHLCGSQLRSKTNMSKQAIEEFLIAAKND